jgi:hypothetical protein
VGDSGGGVEVAKKTKNKKRWVVEMRVMKGKYGVGALMVLVGRLIRTWVAWWRAST